MEANTGVVSIDALRAKILTRRNPDTLSLHLEHHYKIDIEEQIQLDVGVYRMRIRDGPTWVARLFPSDRSIADVKDEANILRMLEELDFPAERCAHAEPVSEHLGQPVLVTKFIDGEKPKGGIKTFYRLGRLLGRLHASSTEGFQIREGGAWHHISPYGGPKAEIDGAKHLLSAFQRTASTTQQHSVDELHKVLDKMDDFGDLPAALIHPDFVLANAIVPPGGGFQVVDWSGTGLGPRLAPLGWALWVAGLYASFERFDAVLKGYLENIRLESTEIARLAQAMMLRPFILGVWEACMGRKDIGDVAHSIVQIESRSCELAIRAAQQIESLVERS